MARAPEWSCRFTAVLAVALALGATACGSSKPPAAGNACEEKGIVHLASTDTQHVMTCSEACGNGANPPTGGKHCGMTSACRVFDVEESECKWIHNLEHGHAVLLYNCPDGCADELAELKAIWNESGAPKRILVTPWSKLEKRFAAVVWGWSWSGDAVDREAIRCVLQHQDEEAPEAGLGCAQ